MTGWQAADITQEIEASGLEILHHEITPISGKRTIGREQISGWFKPSTKSNPTTYFDYLEQGGLTANEMSQVEAGYVKFLAGKAVDWTIQVGFWVATSAG